MTQPGSLFPHSWATACDVRSPEERPEGALQDRPEYHGQAAKNVLEAMKNGSVPVFDKRTEEGVRFRIYQMGGFEVRTTQDIDADEDVVAVFSLRAPSVSGGIRGEKIGEFEQISRATEYV